MSLLACLRKVLTDKVLRLPDSDGSVVLREKSVMKVKIFGLSDDAMAVRLSKIGSLSGVKDGPWKRVCDYVLVSRNGDSLCVIFVELKRTVTDNSRGLDQLQRSLPLWRYLYKLCHIECGGGRNSPVVSYALIAKKGNQRFDKQRVKAVSRPQIKQYKQIRVSICIGQNRMRVNQILSK